MKIDDAIYNEVMNDHTVNGFMSALENDLGYTWIGNFGSCLSNFELYTIVKELIYNYEDIIKRGGTVEDAWEQIVTELGGYFCE